LAGSAAKRFSTFQVITVSTAPTSDRGLTRLCQQDADAIGNSKPRSSTSGLEPRPLPGADTGIARGQARGVSFLVPADHKPGRTRNTHTSGGTEGAPRTCSGFMHARYRVALPALLAQTGRWRPQIGWTLARRASVSYRATAIPPLDWRAFSENAIVQPTNYIKKETSW
jgi:hypothetical protein